MKRAKRVLAWLLTLAMLATLAPAGTIASAAPEIVAGGYEIDMEDLPTVYFSEHPEWQELYDAAWHSHKSNIKKCPTVINHNDVYFIDEAFNPEIYAWDTMFMMLFDKYGYNQFPTLNSLDNFYFTQFDSENFEVAEIVGAHWGGDVQDSYYDNTREHHNQGVGKKPGNSTVGYAPEELRSQAFVDKLNEGSGKNAAFTDWKLDTDNGNNGYPVFDAESYAEPDAVSFAGDGSEGNPFRITSAADLEELARRVNSGEEDTAGKHYLLTTDIVLTGENNHTPIGSEEKKFRGTFDGGFHTVSGMRIDTTEMTQGLFGFVEGGTVKNVGVVDAEIYCEQNSGVIVAQAKVNASVLNCFVRDAVIKGVDFLSNGMATKRNNVLGGVVGMLESGSVVGNCYSVDCSVQGRNYIGGVVGLVRNGDPVVTNCYSSSDVLFNGDGYIYRKRNESDGKTYYDYADVTGLNPPLWAWAEWEQYKVHGDKSRFTTIIQGPGQQTKTLFDRLAAHYAFIEREKKMASGLYGKTSGDANGLDDSPNQDYPWVTATAGKGEQTYNDLSIQQAQLAYYLAMIADEIGRTEDAAYFSSEHARVSALINEKLWSEELGFYFNLAPDGETQTNIATPTGLWAMIARVATQERASAMVEDYGLNSQKMFRPNGLSTACYDDPAFRPKGKYWNGGVWSPTSYQYIKGLEAYGYDDVAFQEAIRHANALYRVYQKGFEGQNTLWENYSPDYTRPGSSKNDGGCARPNFVGWTGALAIGVVIEDILGVTLDGPRDTVNWNIHLTEEHGIENIWMRDNDLQVNRVSLQADARKNASDAVDITVKAERPLTLNVKNGGETLTLEVPAGESRYHIPGRGDLQDTPYLMAVDARAFSQEDASLAKDHLEKNASDYVFFRTEEDASVTDGILNKVSKSGTIYNVNSIGYRSNLALRDDAGMQALGFDGAQALVKQSHIDGEEGFMLMAPADNALRTLKVVVGVQNARATLCARLSDASQAEVSQQVSGGAEEATYVIEIPYRAADEGQNLYVEYRINDHRQGAQISLKGIVLEDGGTIVPLPPKNLRLTPGDGTLTVNASSQGYDSYVFYVGESEKDLSRKYSAPSLPFEITGLDNFKKYYVAAAGVKDGVESPRSAVANGIPEPEGATNQDRAQADLDAALPLILAENRDFAHLTAALNFAVNGPIYGSTLEISASTADDANGVMRDGSVVRPIQPMRDKNVALTIKSIYKGAEASLEQPAVVTALDLEQDAYAAGASYAISSALNLTEEGTKDWVQFCSRNDSEYARKKTEQESITNFTHLDSSYTEVTGDAPFRYSFDDQDVKDGPKPQNVRAIVSKFLGNGFTFDLPYSESLQKVKVYAGCYRAKGMVELLINGKVLFRDYVDVDHTSLTINDFRAFDINFKAASPEDQITVRYTMAASYTTGGNGGSLILPAVTLQEISDPVLQKIDPEEVTRIEAESYERKSAVANVENCSEGGKNVGTLSAGEWLLYNVDVEQSAPYQFSFRMAANNAVNPQIELLLDDEPVAVFDRQVHTSGWQSWETFTMEEPVFLQKGGHTLRLRYTNAGTNLNWLELRPMPRQEKVLTVQYGTNAKLSVEGAYEALIERDGVLGATVYAGDALTLTFTPANGPFASAKLNGEDIPFEPDGCTYTFTMPNDKTSLRFVFTSVSKDILETLLVKANEVTDEQLKKLVPSIREKFIAARDDAQTVFENDKATQDEVNEAWKELLDAMHYLSFEEGTKDELAYWLDYAAQLNLDNFTPKSQEGYAEALAYAEEIFNDEGETLKAEVEKAAKNLHDAILRLEFKANTETLAAFVQQAQEINDNIDKYLDGDEKDAFIAILPQAEAVLEDANATQKQVDEMADELYKAMMNLRMIPDKKVLKALIDEAEVLNPDDYTEASYAILRAALNNALDVYNNDKATPEEITAVCATMEKARAGLVLADKPEEPENKPSDKPSNSGSSGSKKPAGNTSGTGTAVAVTNPVISAAQNMLGEKSVRSDTTTDFTLKRGSAYCFKMTVINGSSAAPSFTVGNGNVLKTQFVAKIGNDYYYRVWAIGTPGQSTGVYTTMAGETPQQHCVVTIA